MAGRWPTRWQGGRTFVPVDPYPAVDKGTVVKELTVKQLAAISGVTVRTLHHYDEIGLLKPASVGANGYRYYGRPELLRLQRILFQRELGVPLNEIGELLELEEKDQLGAMLQHRERLRVEGARLAVLIDTIDRTIASIRGETNMSSAELYKGFSPEKQAGYEKWLVEHQGERVRETIESSRRRFSQMTVEERAAELALGEEAGARIGRRERTRRPASCMGCQDVGQAVPVAGVRRSGRPLPVAS
jgi:MerR family transcriptional regulator, thiopeptide resistance regulator